jgi:hypothetical protein
MTVRKTAMTKLRGFAAPALFAILVAWDGGCSSDQACAYNQKIYAKGESFPAADGCNNCSCVARGEVECTLVGCLGDAGFKPPSDPAAPDARDAAVDGVAVPPDGSAPASYCQWPTTLTFYRQQQIPVPNSIGSYQESYRLTSNELVITRSIWNGYDAQVERVCRPALPPCGQTGQVTVWNVGVDSADPEVKAAFTAPPFTLFGAAPWPSDPWFITPDFGTTILVGQPCPSSDTGTCTPIPPGLQHLRDDLQALASAGVAQAACVEALKP